MQFSLEGIAQAFGWIQKPRGKTAQSLFKSSLQKELETEGWTFLGDEDVVALAAMNASLVPLGAYEDTLSLFIPVTDEQIENAYRSNMPGHEFLVTDGYDHAGKVCPNVRAIYARRLQQTRE